MDAFQKLEQSPSDAFARFHGKDKKTLNTNDSFDRAMLNETVFVLIYINTQIQNMMEHEDEIK